MNLAKTFSGMKDAKVSKRGKFLTEGRYVLRVRSTLVIQPMAGPEAFVLEAEILETSNPEEHPVGSERTWYQSFKFKDSAFGELKKFAYAVFKLDPTNPVDLKKINEDIDPQIEQLMANVVDTNGFKGQTVRCEVLDRPTKGVNPKTGEVGSFSTYNYTPTPENT